jgi:hypothetical protein
MKTEVPPWLAAVIVVAIVLIVGAYLYFGTGPGRQAKEMEAAINASVAKPGGHTMGSGPPSASASVPGGPQSK